RLASLRPLSLYPRRPTSPLYTPSLHDALPIYPLHQLMRHFHYHILYILAKMLTIVGLHLRVSAYRYPGGFYQVATHQRFTSWCRSEEHTSELQSRENLVCRLRLEKKKPEARAP